MGFSEAVRRCLAKYATFSGRARRSEYWYFLLFEILLSIVVVAISAVFFNKAAIDVFNTLISLALLLPSLAVAVRRLHDIGRSGWWLLIGLVPLVGGIVLLIWFCSRSEGENRFGPPPAGTVPG